MNEWHHLAENDGLNKKLWAAHSIGKKIKLVPEFLKGKTKVGHTKDFSYLPTDYCADSNPIIRAEKIVSKHLTLEQKMSLK